MVNHDHFHHQWGNIFSKVFKLKPLFLRGGAGGPGGTPFDPVISVVIQVALGAFHSACANWVHFIFRVPSCFWERWDNMKSLRSKGWMWNLKYLEYFNWKLYISNLRCNYSELCRFKKPDHWHDFEFFLGVSRFFRCSGDVRWCHVNSPPKRPLNSRIPTDPAVESSTVDA